MLHPLSVLQLALHSVNNKVTMDDNSLSINWNSTGNSRNTYILLGIELPVFLGVGSWSTVSIITHLIYFWLVKREGKKQQKEEDTDNKSCCECSTACLKACCCKPCSVECCKACCCKPSKACWNSIWEVFCEWFEDLYWLVICIIIKLVYRRQLEKKAQKYIFFEKEINSSISSCPLIMCGDFHILLCCCGILEHVFG